MGNLYRKLTERRSYWDFEKGTIVRAKFGSACVTVTVPSTDRFDWWKNTTPEDFSKDYEPVPDE